MNIPDIKEKVDFVLHYRIIEHILERIFESNGQKRKESGERWVYKSPVYTYL